MKMITALIVINKIMITVTIFRIMIRNMMMHNNAGHRLVQKWSWCSCEDDDNDGGGDEDDDNGDGDGDGNDDDGDDDDDDDDNEMMFRHQ